MLVFMQQVINGVSLGAVYAIIAVGFALVFNVLKFSNFSHGGVLGISAYVGYLLCTSLGLSFIPTVVLGTLAGGLTALVVEMLGFRLIRKKGGELVYFFVTSVTMLILLQQVLVFFFGSTFYSYPPLVRVTTLSIGGVTVSTLYVVMFFVSALALALLTYLLMKTKLGVAIRAASCDLRTTSLMGANVDLIVSATFFTSGLLAGLSGVLLGACYTLYPQIGQLVVKGFIASVMGGLGSLVGAVIGAMVLGVVEVLLIAVMGSGLSPAVIFVLMVVFLLLRPRGFAGVAVQEKV